jgi:hypothetical protein
MTWPSAFLSGLEAFDRRMIYWIEIEGLPWCLGNISRDASWFSARPERERFDEILPWIEDGTHLQTVSGRLDWTRGRIEQGQMQISVGDIDGRFAALAAARRTDGIQYTVSDLSPSTTLIECYGDSVGWSGTEIRYCGRETLVDESASGGNSAFGAVRGVYRSVPRFIPGPLSVETGRGSVITPYPRFITGRRVWLWLGINATTTADCALIFTGVIRDFYFSQETQACVLTIADQCVGLKKPIFYGIGKWNSMKTIEDVTIAPGRKWTSDESPPEEYEEVSFSYEGSVGNAAPGERIHTWAESGGIFGRVVAAAVRNQTTTTWADTVSYLGHTNYIGEKRWAYGEKISEVVPILPLDGLESDAQPFGPEHKLHPLYVFLCCATSTGALIRGDYSDINGDYDILPTSWGVGMPIDAFDLPVWEQLIADTPHLSVYGWVREKKADFYAWATETLLRPFGFVVYASKEALLSVRQMRYLTETERFSLRIIGPQHIVEIESARIAHDQVIGSVKFTDTPSWITGDYKLQPGPSYTIYDDFDTLTQYPDAQKIEIESELTHSLGRDALWMSSVEWWAHTQYPSRLLHQYYSRFAVPPLILEIVVDLQMISPDIGDSVKLSLDFVPNLFVPSRGTNDGLYDVLERKINWAKGTVTLSLAQYAYHEYGSRTAGPALEITAVSGTTLTIATNSYTRSGNDDLEWLTTMPFTAYIYRSDLSVRYGPISITGVTRTPPMTVTVASMPDGYTREDGDVILLDDYDQGTMPAIYRRAYGWAADAAEKLAGGEPHRLG